MFALGLCQSFKFILDSSGREHKKNKDYSLVLLVEENCDFYTDREGLVGNNKKQEE